MVEEVVYWTAYCSRCGNAIVSVGRASGFQTTVHELYSFSKWPPRIQSNLTTRLISKVPELPMLCF